MTFLRARWFALSAAAICFTWAVLAWLTVVPNQDILVDGIQAQSLLRHPHLVLSFPGQKHGGPLEYPFTVVAEWLAPGNYFANEAIRPVLAAVTGYVVATLFLRLFPSAARWAFLAAIAVGPTMIHGMLGPAENPVGVWWLQPNWDVAWLAVSAGAQVIAGSAHRGWISTALGGVLVGLGFFAHPAIVLLIVPLMTLVLLRVSIRPKALVAVAVGFLLGVAPAAVSYVINAGINTWDPSHGPMLAFTYVRDVGGAALGLTGMTDYMVGLLPYGIGLAPSNGLMSAQAQSAIMWLFVIAVVAVSAISIARALHARRRLSSAGAVAVAWLMAIVTIMCFVVVIDPVWIYGSGLAILFWITIGALPSLFASRVLGAVITVAILIVVGLSTLTHNATYLKNIPGGLAVKVDVMHTQQNLAAAFVDSGVGYVYGSYYDAIPIAYASGSELRVITNHYNRFPLTATEDAQPVLRVAVNTRPTDDWGTEALQHVMGSCTASDSPAAELGSYRIFSCPPGALHP